MTDSEQQDQAPTDPGENGSGTGNGEHENKTSPPRENAGMGKDQERPDSQPDRPVGPARRKPQMGRDEQPDFLKDLESDLNPTEVLNDDRPRRVRPPVQETPPPFLGETPNTPPPALDERGMPLPRRLDEPVKRGNLSLIHI